MRRRLGPPRSRFARFARVAILVVLGLWGLLVLVAVLSDEDPAPIGGLVFVLVPVATVLTVFIGVGWLTLPRWIVRAAATSWGRYHSGRRRQLEKSATRFE